MHKQNAIQDTSLVAYFRISPSLNRKEQQVLEVLKRIYPHNRTNREVAENLRWDICRVTGRTNSLVKKGMVEHSTVRKCRITGFKAIGWAATPEAVGE